ncbi:hypothetical protein D3C87_854140 [compost metagenome]
MTFYTIGHSTRPLEDFLALLIQNGIEMLVDVRAFPHSRRYPQFDQASLSTALRERGIGYRHLSALGGRRPRIRENSPNRGWREPGFRNYADYMATAAFASGLAELLAIARHSRVALMCAEALPWRCHRRLIADCLICKGHAVYDILGPAPARAHQLTPFAVPAPPCVIYPEEHAHEE